MSGLTIDAEFASFVEQDLLAPLSISPAWFWEAFARIVAEFAPQHRQLLEVRDVLQAKIDKWHRQNGFSLGRPAAYMGFLQEIGYLRPEPDDFAITTENVDIEIAALSGPQLVVPALNARYALNAANARWGSLYDALYGSDVIPDDGEPDKAGYDPKRGSRVITYVQEFLDKAVPLDGATHKKVAAWIVKDGALVARLADGRETGLQAPDKFVAFSGSLTNPETILLRNNGLHIEICIDRQSVIGSTDPAGVRDVIIESALSTILDCEDSVAAVDANDKVALYRNLLGLYQGSLTETVAKGEQKITRRLANDRTYMSATGAPVTLHGRSLLLVRNVGHLMTTDIVRDANGDEIPEGLLDAVVTALIFRHQRESKGGFANSRTGSGYIVKPKMHGADEVAMACAMFAAAETLAGLPDKTIKIGIMDEERRTTVNLKACIRAAADRVFFINTGFLDRTGDEIHTSMEAGPVVRKADMKTQAWITAYENWNVDTGLKCGFSGKAQIGKGMWAMPERMADMMTQKIGHPLAGASTAWVPSPTAATLHALHYHLIDVAGAQAKLAGECRATREQLLTPPLAEGHIWSASEIQAELDNNAQSILGYVVRWVEHGIGCSTVPDINGIGLMEDRATLRISSQHIGNWLRHGICTKEQVMETMQRMAVIVDGQNAFDPAYRAMAPNFAASKAFSAACDLVFQACNQANGYTEPLLHAWRIHAKAT